MKKLALYLKVDLQRLFLAKRFWITVLLIPIADMASVVNQASPGTDAFHVLDKIDGLGMGMLIYMLCTIPYAFSYCADLGNRFLDYALIRGSKADYVRSKVIVCALGGAAAALLGRLLTLLLLSFQMPLWDGFVWTDAYYFMELLENGELWKVLLTMLLLKALHCAMLAVSAFMVSTLLPNIFIVCVSPLVFRYVLGHVVWALTHARFLTQDDIYSIYGGLFPTAAGNLAYALFITALFAYGMEIVSRKIIIRRLYND